MFFFFFKQKTAYEMRISDWSSDVCSSDLIVPVASMGRWLDDELAAVGRQMRSGALDRARCLGPMLAIDDDGVHALRDRNSLIPFDPENGPYKAAWLQQVHHAGGVLDAFGEPQDAVERYATPTHRADAGITKHSLGFVHIGFPAAIRAQECAMDRDDAGVLLDRDNKGRRKSPGGTSTALAARVETSVDPIRNDRPPLAQVAIGQCASEGFGVTPDRERELVEVRLAVLTLPWVVIGGREDLACP